MHTKPIEDYLRAIYELDRHQTKVTTAALTERLAVKPSTVVRMIRRLAEMGLVNHQPYQPVSLTEQGRQAGLRILRFHRLLELFLVEKLNVPWDQVHREADRWEHVVSEDLINRMDSLLGYPSHNPHGATIPRPHGLMSQPNHQPLLALTVGESAQVVKIQDDDPVLLRYLAAMGLGPGSQVCLVEILPFEGPLAIQIDGYQQRHLGRSAAGNIFVTPLPSSSQPNE